MFHHGGTNNNDREKGRVRRKLRSKLALDHRVRWPATRTQNSEICRYLVQRQMKTSLRYT